MVSEEEQSPVVVGDPNGKSLFSPRFKSLAAMAGWDEEAILVAALVVEDTPDRLSKHKKRSGLQVKTPPSSSRRKRRAQRRSPVSDPVLVLDLDEEEESNNKQETDESKVVIEKKQTEEEEEEEEKKRGGDELRIDESSEASCSKSPLLPCMDKLREELSCAICLEICYEPSTTNCGHSFCKKCLRSAADKCGKKCPKCRQLISYARACTVNTVLWNTIQLLFPKEIEARKAAEAVNSVEDEPQTHNVRTRSYSRASSSQTSSARRGRRPRQDEDTALALRLERENLVRLLGRDGGVRRWRSSSNGDGDGDAALALRLQREEFADAFRETNDQNSTTTTHLLSARANLRAMASRAINIRRRRRHPS